MERRPPRSTRTDTLFPYTTLFRSAAGAGACERAAHDDRHRGRDARAGGGDSRRACGLMAIARIAVVGLGLLGSSIARAATAKLPPLAVRLDERRVGKECVSTCRSRCERYP